MNPIELFHRDGISAGVWACGKCQRFRGTKAEAERCCNWSCGACGVNTQALQTECNACGRTRRATANKKKLDEATEVKDYDGWIYTDVLQGYNNGYFQSVEDFIDYAFDELEDDEDMPEFVFTCDEEAKSLSLRRAIESLCEEGYEGMEDNLSGMEELEAAVAKWNELNAKHLKAVNRHRRHKVAVNYKPEARE